MRKYLIFVMIFYLSVISHSLASNNLLSDLEKTWVSTRPVSLIVPAYDFRSKIRSYMISFIDQKSLLGLGLNGFTKFVNRNLFSNNSALPEIEYVSFDDLLPEIQTNIISFFDQNTLVKFELTTKKWQTEIEKFWINKELDLSNSTLSDNACVILSQGRFPHLILQEVKLTAEQICILMKYGNFKTLDFGSNSFKSAELEALASGDVAKLEKLSLADNHFSDPALIELTTSHKFLALKVLNLNFNCFGSSGMRVLEASDTFPALEILGLIYCRKGGERTVIFPKLDNFPFLRELYLSDNNFGKEGIETLVSSCRLSILERLDIACNIIGDEGAVLLASGNFPNLKILNLSHNEIEVEGATALMKSSGLSNLIDLDLSKNFLGSALIFAKFPEIKVLNLYDTDIAMSEGKGIEDLVGSANFPVLEDLNLSLNHIKDFGAIALAKCDKFPRLKKLNLKYCLIKHEGIAAFVASKNYPIFEELRLSFNTEIEDNITKLINSAKFRTQVKFNL